MSTVILCGFLLCTGASAIHVGQSYEELIEELGPPRGKMGMGKKMALTYDGGVIELERGVVTFVPDGFAEQAEARQQKRAYEEEQKARGLVKHGNQWVTPEKAARLQQNDADRSAREHKKKRAARKAKHNTTPDVRVIRNEGKAIKIANLLVKGNITIVAFFADWCAPCRQLDPVLRSLADKYDEISLVKIDIVNWSTPVVKQYTIKRIPYVLVFDANGEEVGKAGSDAQAVIDLCNQARR